MRYIKRNLLNNEYIIKKANLTNFIYLNELFCIMLVILYLMYIKLFIKDEIMALLCILPFLVFSIILYLKELIRDLTTELVITNKRVLGRCGFIKIKTLDTLISSIDNVQIEISFLGRILRYGTIIIETKSEFYKYKLISNPLKLKKIIMNEASSILK